MNNDFFFFSFSFYFPFPLFSLKHRGVGGLQATEGCGMFTAGRGGGWYQAVEMVSELPTARRGFQRYSGELGRLEEATTEMVVG